jgi:hypothetical protein
MNDVTYMFGWFDTLTIPCEVVHTRHFARGTYNHVMEIKEIVWNDVETSNARIKQAQQKM